MRRRAFKIRRWLALAVALAALVIVSGAQARLYGGEDQGRATGSDNAVVTNSAPVSTGPGFDWGYAMAGVGVALVVVISGIGFVQLGRNRRRLATLL